MENFDHLILNRIDITTQRKVKEVARIISQIASSILEVLQTNEKSLEPKTI